MNNFFDLKDANYAYMLGLFQADGHLAAHTRNRGRFAIEMSVSNKSLLQKISEFIPYYCRITERTRNTNFGDNHHSVCLRVYNLEFRNILNSKGVPYGKKSDIIQPPIEEFSEQDYYRGLVDGDGSLGITSTNIPFISFAVKSQQLCNAYLEYIEKITGCRKILNRNQRDDIYNIVLYREPAQLFTKNLYYPGCNLCIERKQEKSFEVVNWKRPNNQKYIPMKKWEDWEDEFILSHSIQESMQQLQRTKGSVATRLYRLKQED